ncbi:MAG TPA: CaiB/BaiF CoA-transferase family protein [Gemmataceae bacterium]|nr:CaiB/BaiF CoA-transferase family protein [Gemmataceae bacterium]
MPTDPHGPLADVRVLDASRVLAGPLCGQILGDLGADVIKVERPGSGDDTRAWGPPFAGSLSAYYLSCNRNKRGITLDLAKPEGLGLFHELARRSDILLENFRAASADKLGVSPAKLLAVNPRLIVCSISGFGRTGPLADLPGYDFAIQALSGLMSITGPVEGPPFKVGVAVTDVLTGLDAAVAVLACLHARQQSGHGYVIDLALLDCAVAAQVNLAQAYLTSGVLPPRQGNAHLQIVPYQAFATADDWLVLAVGNDGQWQRFCSVAERPDLAADERFATNTQRVQERATLVPMLEEVLRRWTTATWQEKLTAAEVPHAPVWDYARLFAQPQAEARGLRVTVRDPEGRPVDLVGTPFHIDGATLPPPSAPPQLGQDTDRVLGELLGLDAAQLEQLRAQGVIGP